MLDWDPQSGFKEEEDNFSTSENITYPFISLRQHFVIPWSNLFERMHHLHRIQIWLMSSALVNTSNSVWNRLASFETFGSSSEFKVYSDFFFFGDARVCNDGWTVGSIRVEELTVTCPRPSKPSSWYAVKNSYPFHSSLKCSSFDPVALYDAVYNDE